MESVVAALISACGAVLVVAVESVIAARRSQMNASVYFSELAELEAINEKRPGLIGDDVRDKLRSAAERQLLIESNCVLHPFLAFWYKASAIALAAMALYQLFLAVGILYGIASHDVSTALMFSGGEDPSMMAVVNGVTGIVFALMSLFFATTAPALFLGRSGKVL